MPLENKWDDYSIDQFQWKDDIHFVLDQHA
jgi:hypothetical protein